MAKWSGIVCFRDEKESEMQPGVWVKELTEKNYYGEIIKNLASLQNESELNPTMLINNQISIISDPYARENFTKIIYLTFMGSKWKPASIEVQYPRLVITLGGLYNEQE